MKNMKLWYTKPSDMDWNEALPIGNGRLGAMVYGNVKNETIQLNEDSIWYGKPIDRHNPKALENLPVIRDLIFNKRIPEAERLLKLTFSSLPRSERPYQSLGELTLEMHRHNGEITNYRRELDLENAIATASYSVGGIDFQREIFSSHPDDVIVMKFTSSKPGALSFDACLTRERFFDENIMNAEDTISIHGNCGEGGVKFSLVAMAAVKGNDATIKTGGGFLVVENADEATIILSCATSFRYENYKEQALEKAKKAVEQPYIALKKNHIADYTELFNRVDFQLSDETGNSSLPTDVRLERLKEGAEDNGLMALYFQFGRYLLISSSRPGSLPANLQGIWNNQMRPRWDSKYTINVNTEMNYWPAEVCNLSECHLPLFGLLKRMVPNGRKTARVMYNCRDSQLTITPIYGPIRPHRMYIFPQPIGPWARHGFLSIYGSIMCLRRILNF